MYTENAKRDFIALEVRNVIRRVGKAWATYIRGKKAVGALVDMGVVNTEKTELAFRKGGCHAWSYRQTSAEGIAQTVSFQETLHAHLQSFFATKAPLLDPPTRAEDWSYELVMTARGAHFAHRCGWLVIKHDVPEEQPADDVYNRVSILPIAVKPARAPLPFSDQTLRLVRGTTNRDWVEVHSDQISVYY